jgi:hypothetical protein
MKAFLRLSCLVLLAGLAVPAYGQYVYMRSDVDAPWGQSTNEDAMDNVFNAGGWTTQYYETADPNSLFITNTQFIFMEGGDSSYLPFASFLSANLNSLTTWLNNGGRLLIMSAPNDPLNGASVTLPLSIQLNSDSFYGSAANSAYANDTTMPIFNGPFSTAYYFTGDFFSHGYFIGANVDAIMQSNLNQVVLGQAQVQQGLMVFGGMTTDNFQLPQPAAHSLLENIIYYTAYVSLPVTVY